MAMSQAQATPHGDPPSRQATAHIASCKLARDALHRQLRRRGHWPSFVMQRHDCRKLDGMSEKPLSLSTGERHAPVPLVTGVHRYFFYGWLFRDADRGSSLERAAALRHNQAQAKWLPVYMGRGVAGGAVVLAFEVLFEQVLGWPMVAAAFAIGLIFVALFLLITAISWAFLRGGGRSH